MIHVVQSFAVRQQFRNSVCRSFEWFSSISLSAIVRLQFMVHAGRLVHPVVQLLCMQSVVLLSLTSFPQPQNPKHDSGMLGFFTHDARHLYSVKIFYQPICI